VDVEFEGHAKVSSIPGFLGFGNKVKQHARVEYNFPDIVQFGYAFWPTPKWKIEVDGDWTHWDVTNSQSLKSQGLKSTFGLTQSQLKTKLNWEDSWIVSLGTQYEIKDGVFLRGGWYWSEDSVPEKNFTPTVADSDRTGVSVGLGWRCKSWTIDLACQANFSLDRDVNNNVGSNPFPPVNQSVDGTYESWSIAGAFSLGYHF
jgi:long-chain fatty acid transport protein